MIRLIFPIAFNLVKKSAKKLLNLLLKLQHPCRYHTFFSEVIADCQQFLQRHQIKLIFSSSMQTSSPSLNWSRCERTSNLSEINHFPSDQRIRLSFTSLLLFSLASFSGIILKVEKLVFPDPTQKATTNIIAINMESRLNSFIIFDIGQQRKRN